MLAAFNGFLQQTLGRRELAELVGVAISASLGSSAGSGCSAYARRRFFNTSSIALIALIAPAFEFGLGKNRLHRSLEALLTVDITVGVIGVLRLSWSLLCKLNLRKACFFLGAISHSARPEPPLYPRAGTPLPVGARRSATR
jgi:hypothetical protein